MDRKLVFSLLILSSLLWIQTSYCAKQAGVARKDDIPFIRCQVCEKLAKELFEQVREKQAKISPKKVSEYEVIEISENVCNLKKQEADWMLKIDIVEKGDRLEVMIILPLISILLFLLITLDDETGKGLGFK